VGEPGSFDHERIPERVVHARGSGAHGFFQLIPESDEFAFDDIDLLDPTRLILEELVPVTPVGRMVLDRNPENFPAETEQVALCVSNIVPGIEITYDPLMQARMFSYVDTQLTRLGGFAQTPMNQPLNGVHYHQQDGFHQHAIPSGQANYHLNSLGGGCPVVPGAGGDAFGHTPERVDGTKARQRSETFANHSPWPSPRASQSSRPTH
jgi:catalase